MAQPDIHAAYQTALTAAEKGTTALRDIWPRGIPQLAQPQDHAMREALRNIEDGWAALLRVAGDFAES